jgi:serine/threonine-protein kinase
MTTHRTTPVPSPKEPGRDRLATAETHFAADEPRASAAEARTTVEGWVGQVVDGRYRIVRSLGEGGMGAVFAAEHLKLGHEVALKIVQPELAEYEQLAARFAREAMASARLNHPHVASALDYGTLPDGGAYLVMQLARGQSLRSLLDERTALPWPMACEIAAQIADAAAAAHAIGIIHRDLKPDNVFVEEREDGSVLSQVLDFGIARVIVTEGSAPEAAAPGRPLTTVGSIMGTPGYMAPEQAMGRPADPRADLYALGVMLLEMVTGVPLFEGETLTAIVTEQLTGCLPRIAERCAPFALPPALEALLRGLLAPDPTQRPERAADVRDELRQIVRQASPGGVDLRRSGEMALPPVSGTPTPYVPVDPVMTALPPAASGASAALVERLRSLPSARIFAALGLFVALVIGAFALGLAGGDDATPAESGDAGPRLDAEGQRLFGELVGADDRDVRRSAAEILLARPPEGLTPVAKAAAELELARGCRERKDAIVELGELGDASVLPALERLAATPRRGCGFLGTKDCHRCLRDDLEAVVTQLQAAR